jgi:HSP20 family protein
MLRLLDATPGDVFGATAAGGFPPINVTQDDECFYVRAEIPGVKPEELSISTVHNRVSLSGRREIPAESDRVSYHRKERAEGSFNRTVTLPTEVDADRVSARYAEGILTVTLPKAAEAKPRQIKVK